MVPYTQGSSLQKVIQAAENNFNTTVGCKPVRVIERGGAKLIHLLGRNDPWSAQSRCSDVKCPPCNSRFWLKEQTKLARQEKSELPKDLETKTSPLCRREGMNYTLQCLSCLNQGLKTLYRGEGSRSARQRHLEHAKDLESGLVSSPLVIHSIEEHGGELPGIHYVIQALEPSALYRAARESTMIAKQVPGPTNLNRCMEWGAPRVPVMSVTGGDAARSVQSGLNNPNIEWTRTTMEKVESGSLKRVALWTRDQDQKVQCPTMSAPSSKRQKIMSQSEDQDLDTAATTTVPLPPPPPPPHPHPPSPPTTTPVPIPTVTTTTPIPTPSTTTIPFATFHQTSNKSTTCCSKTDNSPHPPPQSTTTTTTCTHNKSHYSTSLTTTPTPNHHTSTPTTTNKSPVIHAQPPPPTGVLSKYRKQTIHNKSPDSQTSSSSKDNKTATTSIAQVPRSTHGQNKAKDKETGGKKKTRAPICTDIRYRRSSDNKDQTGISAPTPPPPGFDTLPWKSLFWQGETQWLQNQARNQTDAEDKDRISRTEPCLMVESYPQDECQTS